MTTQCTPSGPTPGSRRVLLASPRGWCAGVHRAVLAVETALEQYGPPIYVRHEIVHNKHVVQSLKKKGAIFIEETAEVPEGSIVLFSAHGVAPTVHTEAAERNLTTIDATCPLVTKVHREAIRYAREDYDILLIGHEGHEEVIGTTGEAPDHITVVDGPDDVENIVVRDDSKVVWLSQTTLSVEETMQTVNALETRFPDLTSPPTQRRHLLRRTEPPDRSQETRRRSRTRHRRRLPELLQLRPPCRDRPQRRCSRRPSCRLLRRDRRSLARQRHHRRPDLRRLRPRRPGRRCPAVVRRTGIRQH